MYTGEFEHPLDLDIETASIGARAHDRAQNFSIGRSLCPHGDVRQKRREQDRGGGESFCRGTLGVKVAYDPLIRVESESLHGLSPIGAGEHRFPDSAGRIGGMRV